MQPRRLEGAKKIHWVASSLRVFVVAFVMIGTAEAQNPSKQAVVETSLGTFIIDLTPDVAPNQVAYFTKLAQEGAYEGTTFHRAVKYGMVQGGDPISKDPAKRSVYGTGGQNAVKAEARAEKMTRGSVAAVLVPGRPDSAGAQFFVVLTDQPTLGGQYTVFGQVFDGMDVLQKISETPVDGSGLATDRVEIKRVTVRDKPAERFVTESAAALAAYRAVLDTSMGRSPSSSSRTRRRRPFGSSCGSRMPASMTGMAFHRVAPGFVIQTGALNTKASPLSERQQKLVRNLQPEFNDTKHVKGIVSMARGDDPSSAQTSFFICTGASTALDGVYTAFGRVVDGIAVVEAIEKVPRTGETPNERVELRNIRIEAK